MTRKRTTSNHTATKPRHAPSLPALADELNISGSSAKNLCRDGLIKRAQGYSIFEAQELLRRRTLRVAHLQKGTTAEAAILAKTRKLEADAARAELELEIARSEVISRAVVTRQWRQAVIVVRDRFKNLGRSLAPQLINRGPIEIQTIVDGRVYEILRLLSHQELSPAETTSDEPSNKPKEDEHENPK